MDINQYIERIKNVEIDDAKVDSIEKLYLTTLPMDVKLIVSLTLEDCFIDEKCRIISFKEILNSEVFTGVDFSKLKMIPLVDCKDDDYIVYNFATSHFEMYNIYDEVSFRESKNMEELLLTLE